MVVAAGFANAGIISGAIDAVATVATDAGVVSDGADSVAWQALARRAGQARVIADRSEILAT